MNLNTNTHGRSASGGVSRSGSVQGRRSTEIMGIAEEEEDEEMEVEEVEEFTPVNVNRGEFVEDLLPGPVLQGQKVEAT